MKIHRFFLMLLAGMAVVAVPRVACLAQVSILGKSVQEEKASVGSEYKGSIVLRNDGPAAETVRVYQTDYRFTADGVSEFREAGTNERSNARWITFGAQTVLIAPHQTSTVTYRVKIPELQGQSATGSYWSVAMIESQPSAMSRNVNSRGMQLQAVVRHAVQLVTHVGSMGAASVALTNVKFVIDRRGLALQFDAGNDGVRARKLSLSVHLYGEDGLLVGKYSSERGLVLPGCSIRQLFDVGTLAKGTYLAFIVADAGDDDLFAGNFKLKL